MPGISRFFGIIIAMFYNEHNSPHFHARYGEFKDEQTHIATQRKNALDQLQSRLQQGEGPIIRVVRYSRLSEDFRYEII
jgi:hypothetical protein